MSKSSSLCSLLAVAFFSPTSSSTIASSGSAAFPSPLMSRGGCSTSAPPRSLLRRISKGSKDTRDWAHADTESPLHKRPGSRCGKCKLACWLEGRRQTACTIPSSISNRTMGTLNTDGGPTDFRRFRRNGPPIFSQNPHPHLVYSPRDEFGTETGGSGGVVA
eukprot:64655-Rhodomonas_salina.2